MRRALSTLPFLVAACATNVVHPGQLYATEDPDTGELRVELRDVETDSITIDGFGFEGHEGAYFVLQRVGNTIEWQGATEVWLIASDQEVKVDVTSRELDAESIAPYGIQQFERVAFQLDDDDLAWLAGSPDLRIELDQSVTRVAPKVMRAVRDFAARVLGSHEGKRDLPPLVVPSDI